MIRRRGHVEEEASSDEEDAFSSLSNKPAKIARTELPSSVPSFADTQKANLPVSVTSSMKRHHKTNDSRKAKMDALLQELEVAKDRAATKPNRYLHDKKGSHVDPEDEHTTTNIFVSNLDPSITE